MHRRDSLGTTTKILRLSTETIRKFKTRRSQSTASSISDVFADKAETKGQAGLSVSGMKLRGQNNLDGNQGRSGETGQGTVVQGNCCSGECPKQTKSNKWRKEQPSLVKQSKNAMMSSISPSEEQTSSKAKKSWNSLYDERAWRQYKLKVYLPVMTIRR